MGLGNQAQQQANPQQLLQGTLQDHPGIAKMLDRTGVPVAVTSNQRHENSETFLPGDSGGDYRPRQSPIDSVEVQRGRHSQGLSDEVAKSAMAGELMHMMGASDAEGNAYSPEFKKLKMDMISSMTLEDMEFARERVARMKVDAKKNNFDLGTNFTNENTAIQGSFADGRIRGALKPELFFGEHAEEDRKYNSLSRENFSPVQRSVLGNIRRVLDDEDVLFQRLR